jgi:hypothetical protein
MSNTKIDWNISSLKTSNYTITDNDYYIAIGELSGNITISMPATPNKGQQYLVKDVDGYVGTYLVTISGNGKNIDGNPNVVMAHPHASYTLTYTGNQWSISVGYAGDQAGSGYGLFTNRPVQGQSGRTYYATDQSVFYYDDGSSWKAIGPNIKPVVLPSVSEFTWVNQSGASATDSGAGIYLKTLGTNSGSISSRLLVKSAPSTPYTISACLEYAGVTSFGSSNGPVGLCFRQSSDGKFQAFTIDFNQTGDCVMASTKYNSTSSINSVYHSDDSGYIAGTVWLRIKDDGTNRLCEYSRDGVNYNNFHFVSRTDFITADQVGFFVDPIYQDIRVTFVSWEES